MTRAQSSDLERFAGARVTCLLIVAGTPSTIAAIRAMTGWTVG